MRESGTYVAEIDGKWYAFAMDTWKHEVYSIGSDNPKDGGRWFACATESGIKYVASSSPTRAAAYAKARRYGIYRGKF